MMLFAPVSCNNKQSSSKKINRYIQYDLFHFRVAVGWGAKTADACGVTTYKHFMHFVVYRQGAFFKVDIQIIAITIGGASMCSH